MRQIGMPFIGPDGQRRLREASVLVIGAGGLGSVLLYCLAGMGVGRIAVYDGDTVSESNLDRQFLYTPENIGQSKAEAAAARLRLFRPDICCTAFFEPVRTDNAADAVAGKQLALCCADSLSVRQILNAACVRSGVPLISGGVSGLTGSVQTVLPGTACLSCLYGSGGAPDIRDVPSPAPVVSAVSALMAHAAGAVLTDGGSAFAGALFVFDGRTMTVSREPLKKSPRCPVCGDGGR